MSMLVIDQDQFAPAVVHGTGRYVLSRAQIGTRYAMAEVRTLVDPRNPHDLQEAHRLQDAIAVEQERRGMVSDPGMGQNQSDARSATRSSHLGRTVHDSRGMFGSRTQVDPIRHLIGTAMHWGGNPEEEATYLNVTPRMNDGTTVHRLTVRDVPVDGFWSISVYDADGYFEPTPPRLQRQQPHGDARSGRLRDRAVRRLRQQTPNCLSIMPGWNYMVRLYSPRAEILNGSWLSHWRRPSPSPTRARFACHDVRSRGESRRTVRARVRHERTPTVT